MCPAPTPTAHTSNWLYDVPMLKNDGLNFQTWKHRTELILMSRGLIPIVKGTKKEPDGSDVDTLNNWRTCELDAQVQIQLTLEEE
jgi:hypothetical protein